MDGGDGGALAAHSTDEDQIAARSRLVKAYADADRLSLTRHRGGFGTFQTPLGSQRQPFAARRR